MTVHSNSLEAIELIRSNLSEKRDAVFMAVFTLNIPVSNEDISAYLDWPINKITPRTGELKTQGYLIVKETRKKQHSNNPVDYYIVNPKALEAGFKPSPIRRHPRKSRTALSRTTVHDAARVLGQHAASLRHRPKQEQYPLFGETS